MPKLAGTYSSELVIEMGHGQTHQEQMQKLGWFAIYLDGGHVVVRALNAEGMPTVVSKMLDAREFFRDYTPDQEAYVKVIAPLLRTAHETLKENGGDVAALGKDEATAFKALVLDGEMLPGMSREERHQLALGMLEDLPDYRAIYSEHKEKINVESIASRKDGLYDEAIGLYGAMLRLTPEDDHIFFNVARVYFEKQDYVSCRKYLLLALDHDPSFDEARQFLDYLDQRRPPEHADRRSVLRFRFHQAQPAVVTIGGRKVNVFVVDVSESGVLLKLARGVKAQFAEGLDLTLTGSSPLLAPILDNVHGKVVWHTTKTCGVTLSVSLDTTTDDFKKIIAYSRLV